MSEVADGPEISVSGARRRRTDGSTRWNASLTEAHTSSAGTTQMCRSGTSVSARMP